MKMNNVEVNGKMVYIKPTKSKFHKSAFMMSEEIYNAFSKIGITREFIDLQIARNPLKLGQVAQISWVVNGKDFYFACSTQDRYVDNLGVITKVIEQESYAIRNGLKSFGQVMNQFRIGFDESEKIIQKSPREIIGVEKNCQDFEYITFKYKQKSKELHPDMESGNADSFKELNNSYEILKKEFDEK